MKRGQCEDSLLESQDWLAGTHEQVESLVQGFCIVDRIELVLVLSIDFLLEHTHFDREGNYQIYEVDWVVWYSQRQCWAWTFSSTAVVPY